MKKKNTFKTVLITALFIMAVLAFGALILSRFVLPGLVAESAPPASDPAEETGAAPSDTPEPTPSPEPTQEPEPEHFIISMVGDCTLSSPQLNNHFEEVLRGDMTWPFSGTLQYFENDYLSIGNLECSFSDSDLTGHTTFQFLGPTSHAKILTEGSIEFVTLANNHTDDFGPQGLIDTEAALDAEGIFWAPPDGTYVYKSGDGITVGIYAGRWMATADEVAAGVKKLSSENNPDLIIVCMHWGIEGSYRVTADQEQIGKAAIDAGADIVYGSHPHVLQQVDEYNGGIIINSLGNWSFGGNTAPRDRDTAIIQMDIVRDADGSVSITGWSAVPCCLSSTVGANDYRPEPYEEGTDEFARTMSKLDGSFSGPDLVVDYSAYHKNQNSETEGGEDPPAETTPPE